MKRLIITLNLLVVIFLGFAVRQTVYAADPSTTDSVCEGIGLAAKSDGNCDTATNDSPSVPKIISVAISILSYVAGITAVIMIVLSGFKYITSGGDSSKIASAKTTLTYALIGLAIAALAQVLVLYVFKQATTDPTTTSSGGTNGANVVKNL